MKKKDFVLEDNIYETKLNGIVVKIHEDEMNQKTIAYASRVLELYLLQKEVILEHILNNGILNFYEGRYTKEEILGKLNEVDIEIITEGWGTLTWLNSELDEHIIGVEFNNDMQLSYVSIDG